MLFSALLLASPGALAATDPDVTACEGASEGDACTRALRRDGRGEAGSAASDHEHVEFDRGGHETPTIPASD